MFIDIRELIIIIVIIAVILLFVAMIIFAAWKISKINKR
jgi:ABC-type antimicrobial peptide transport system permease subunit